MRRKAFTLLELIVVIIIIGILATLGFVQYVNIIEKGRKGEARANLGTLRQLEVAFHEDTPVSGGNYGALATMASGLPADCTNTHYYSYSCSSTDGSCTASRCTADGKPPQAAEEHTIKLDVNGTFTGTGAWQ